MAPDVNGGRGWFSQSLGRVMLRVVEAQVARSARTGYRLLRATIAASADGGDIHVVLKLVRSHPDSRDALPIEIAAPGLVLTSMHAASDAGSMTCGRRSVAGARLVLLHGEKPWMEAEIGLAFRWDGTPLCVPDMLPRPVPASVKSGDTLPRFHMRLPAGVPLVIGGITAPGDASGGSYAEAVLIRDGKLVPVRDEPGRNIILTNTFARTLSQAEEEWVSFVVGRIQRHFRECTCTDPAATPVIVQPGKAAFARTLRSGSIVIASPWEFGLTPAGEISEPNDFYVALQLAGIWVGGGCRLLGKHAAEAEFALRVVLALDWMDRIGGRGVVDRARAALARESKRWSRYSLRRFFTDGVRPWRAAAIGMELHERAPRQVHRLGKALSSMWGAYADGHALIRALTDDGAPSSCAPACGTPRSSNCGNN